MKFYRVIKENFLWEVGAILRRGEDNHYHPIEDIWNKLPNQKERIGASVIEGASEYFERVYENNLTKALYVTSEELKKLYGKFKS